MRLTTHESTGFTILELLVSTAIFMVVCGAMFGLLQISQQKYAIETQMSGSFQEARLGMDQIVRDVNISGYPSASMFSNPASSASYALAPFAWDPGYLSNGDCQIGAGCATPNDHDLIVETNFGSGVSWIRYQLVGTILYRAVVPKTVGGDPVSATSASGVVTPLVNNVIYNPSGSVLDQINIDYPNMLPGGVQPALFLYTCNTPSGPVSCSTAGTYNAPRYISAVDITLIVQTPQQDMQTQALKLIELSGRGRPTNVVSY
jgi:type II secretory pathway pseudopilin PulG